VKQLAQDVLRDIFSELTAATYGAPVIPALAPTDFDYKTMLAICEACSEVKMPVIVCARFLLAVFLLALYMRP